MKASPRGFALLALLLGLLLSPPARAIPPFARRYAMACGTCHVGGPTRLTSFGEAFRDNGYRVPGDDASYLREPPIPLGAPARAALFPQVVWPNALPATVPVGVSATLTGLVSIPRVSADAGLAFQAEAALLLGGSIGDHVAFLGVLEGGTEGLHLDQLFLVGRSLFERLLGETRLNLKVGRMDLDLFPIQPGLRTTAAKPLPLDLQAGRAAFTLGEPQEAIEVYGLVAGRLKWLVGVANGFKPIADLRTRRDVFGRLSLKLGGERLDYRDGRPGYGEAPTVSLGAAAYYGASVTESPMREPLRSDILRASADLRLRVRGLDLIGYAVVGQDDDADALARRLRHLCWYAAADYAVLPWLLPYARFEEARFDDPQREPRRRLVLGAAFFVFTNLRLRLEGLVGLADPEPHQVLLDLFTAL